MFLTISLIPRGYSLTALINSYKQKRASNDGFKITAKGSTLNIGKGRYYLGGLLCENDSDDITYDTQPDLPNADIYKALGDATWGLVYLTPLNDLSLR